MSYYQQGRYQQQQLHYNSKGGQTWSDGYSYKKPSGTYANATGYSFDNGGGGGGLYSYYGSGGMASSAKGQFWSGDGYGSNDALGGGQWRGGGCKIQSYPNNVRIYACSVVPSYQSEMRQWSIGDPMI